jgi:serine/threonine-protein kinase/endoribonuclease IRE1
MPRRPPGPVAQQRKYLLAFATLLLPWLPIADAQLQHPRRVQHQQNELKTPRLVDYIASDKSGAVAPDDLAETPHLRRRSTDSGRDASNNKNDNNQPSSYENNYLYTEDVRALETYALDSSVGAASPPRPRAGPASGTGLSSPQIARSLEDWEVEDFVLLATVDGDLYATDRKTGQERWRVSVDQPMVETNHFRANVSSTDEDYSVVDHYIWLVEPNHDGGLYLWVPQKANDGLIKMGYTMKQMVEELSPYNDNQQNIVYTGDKKTNLVTLDAATGRVLKWFGPSGSQVNEMERCLRPNALVDMDSDECDNLGSGTITLGRTEYTVGIQRADGRAVASLKYSEWVPNTFDNDLLQQYHTRTLDHRYITSQHDGQVYGFDYARPEERPLFAQKLKSPVARVFDIVRPWGATPGSNPSLIALPQPALPAQDDQIDRARSSSIFVNQTEAGSWYAMSGQSYPLILNAPAAKANSLEWWERHPTFEMMSGIQLAKGLVGMHTLEKKSPLLTLDAGSASNNPDVDGEAQNASIMPSAPAFDPLQPGGIVMKASEMAADSVVNFFTNPFLIVLGAIVLIYKYNEIRRWIARKRKAGNFAFRSSEEPPSAETTPEPTGTTEPSLSPVEPNVKPNGFVPNATPGTAGDDSIATEPVPASNRDFPHSVTFAEPLPELHERNGSVSADGLDGTAGAEQGEKKEKKAHRGKRGGAKHKKNKANKTQNSQFGDSGSPVPDEVADAVDKAKNMVENPVIEPDIQTVTSDPEAVSGPILKMGSFEVNTDQQLGTGSNGTVVFAGTFDGRPVAVKRMLIQFNEIATQETRLLRESDDHPNGEYQTCPFFIISI